MINSGSSPESGKHSKSFSYTIDKTNNHSLEFETAENVFFPTHTSQLLIQGARKSIQKPGKLLDLGCGIGVCGLALAKLGYCEPPVYLSDISDDAAKLANRNAERLEVPAVIRQGSLFSAWAGEQFDVIVDDVSGVSEDIAKFSPWFPPGVECQTGRDGTRLIVGVLQRAPEYLNRDGMLVFPVLSLSNEQRVLDEAHMHFSEVSLIVEQVWFLPEGLLRHFDRLEPLLEAGMIRLEQKFGGWLWSTKIYKATSPRGY